MLFGGDFECSSRPWAFAADHQHKHPTSHEAAWRNEPKIRFQREKSDQSRASLSNPPWKRAIHATMHGRTVGQVHCCMASNQELPAPEQTSLRWSARNSLKSALWAAMLQIKR